MNVSHYSNSEPKYVTSLFHNKILIDYNIVLSKELGHLPDHINFDRSNAYFLVWLVLLL